jgi:hypothetical protein
MSAIQGHIQLTVSNIMGAQDRRNPITTQADRLFFDFAVSPPISGAVPSGLLDPRPSNSRQTTANTSCTTDRSASSQRTI